MIKNTPENKARFFALYQGQTFINGINGHSALSFTDINDISLGRIGAKLLLTPLSQITDEDAIEVAKIVCIEMFIRHKKDHYVNRGEKEFISVGHGRNLFTVDINFDGSVEKYNEDTGYCHNPYMTGAIDYLRSKCYALPYMGISVEQLQEWGWIKLKEVQS